MKNRKSYKTTRLHKMHRVFLYELRAVNCGNQTKNQSFACAKLRLMGGSGGDQSLSRPSAKNSWWQTALPARMEQPRSRVMGEPSSWVIVPPASVRMQAAAA